MDPDLVATGTRYRVPTGNKRRPGGPCFAGVRDKSPRTSTRRANTNTPTHHSMIINPEKSKFMVINGNDQEQIARGKYTIRHSDTCVYLSAVLTADGKFTSLMKNHIVNKHCNVLKLFARLYRERGAYRSALSPCVRCLFDFFSAAWV